MPRSGAVTAATPAPASLWQQHIGRLDRPPRCPPEASYTGDVREVTSLACLACSPCLKNVYANTPAVVIAYPPALFMVMGFLNTRMETMAAMTFLAFPSTIIVSAPVYLVTRNWHRLAKNAAETLMDRKRKNLELPFSISWLITFMMLSQPSHASAAGNISTADTRVMYLSRFMASSFSLSSAMSTCCSSPLKARATVEKSERRNPVRFQSGSPLLATMMPPTTSTSAPYVGPLSRLR
mmetsp:Transcript_34689/g.109534  ORF Transcript_34689/g.109534 Transcript_34689/m.109534 type:complete len:238 (-) Transcript_34689:500-1213(-)